MFTLKEPFTLYIMGLTGVCGILALVHKSMILGLVF